MVFKKYFKSITTQVNLNVLFVHTKKTFKFTFVTSNNLIYLIKIILFLY